MQKLGGWRGCEVRKQARLVGQRGTEPAGRATVGASDIEFRSGSCPWGRQEPWRV